LHPQRENIRVDCANWRGHSVREQLPGAPSGVARTADPALAPLPVAPLDDRQRLACLRLIRSENVGPVTFRDLINHFGGAEAALLALPELSMRGGRRRPIRIAPREQAEAELEAAHAVGARALFTIEPGYPAALAHLATPPPMLYVTGRTNLFAKPAVAIVGSRNASAAGMAFTRMIATGVGQAGYAVVSGLARGIDGAAHEASLPTGTVAILGGGIDHIYPPEHADLFARVAAEGCLVSENPPGFAPRGQDFPRRNRIISGVSLGVVIVEAAKRSGSLTTARFANEQGRVVMAVPGHPLDPRAEGTNGLLKQGATMVTSADDVLEVLRPMSGIDVPATTVPATDSRRDAATPLDPADLGDHRRRVLEMLGPAPVSLDAVAQATGLDVRAVRVVMLELALAGRLEQHGGQLVSLLPPSAAP
jgi:DNA processing protein